MVYKLSEDIMFAPSAIIIGSAIGLLVPWTDLRGTLLHLVQFILIICGIVMINYEYSKLRKQYDKIKQDTAPTQ